MKCKTGFHKPTKYKGYNDLVSLFESRMLHIRQELPAFSRKLFFIFTALLTSRAPAA